MPVPTLTPTNFVVYDIDHQPLPRMYGLSLFRSNDVTSPTYTKVVQGTVEKCQTFSHSYKSLRARQFQTRDEQDVRKLLC